MDKIEKIDKSLEEEIKRYIPRDQCPVPDFMEAVARHFAEWGAEHLAGVRKMTDKSLEEAAEKFARSYDNGTCDGIAQDCFKAGAEWQARQLLQCSPMPEDTVLFNKGVQEGRRLEREDMMKDAVETELYWDGDFLAIDLNMTALGYSERDKVRIVVLKAEEE